MCRKSPIFGRVGLEDAGIGMSNPGEGNMGRVLLGGVVGGLVVFVWGAVAHMVLPIGSMGIRQIPAESEDAVIASMRDAIHEPGFYFFPGMDMTKAASESEQKAWEAKLRKGPSGILVIHPEGG